MQKIILQLPLFFCLGLISALSCSCSSSEPAAYTGGPITLERPGYSTRPYRIQAPQPQQATSNPAILVRPTIPKPALTPNIFHTPNDISLPTENQFAN